MVPAEGVFLGHLHHQSLLHPGTVVLLEVGDGAAQQRDHQVMVVHGPLTQLDRLQPEIIDDIKGSKI